MKFKSATVLVAANLMPLIGVLFWKWDLAGVLYIYWAECGVIGFYTILKILTIRDNSNFLVKVVAAMYFVSQLSIFMIMYAYLLLSLINNAKIQMGDIKGLMTFNNYRWPIFVLFASHGFSFLTNYIEGGERDRAKIAKLLFQPYIRTYLTHFLLIIGIFSASIAGLEEGIGILVVLVILKTISDLRLHLEERIKHRHKNVNVVKKIKQKKMGWFYKILCVYGIWVLISFLYGLFSRL